MQLKWHRLARKDLSNIRVYIAKENPKAAERVAKSIRQAVDRLSDNPSIGRVGRVLNTKELVVVGTPYIVPYTVAGDMVIILRVLHGAQPWPS